MNRRTYAALLAGTVLCGLASCQSTDHRVAPAALPPLDESREPARPLQLRRVIQAPQGAQASWDAFRGKVVLLEFWATWCGPCIAAIPHLNELAEHFAHEPVVFLSITDEDDETIERFIERREMKSWIGFDDDGRTMRAYGVTGIPHTVIVDQHGRIAAVTSPAMVTEEVIRNVLEGRDTGLPQQSARQAFIYAGVDPASGDDTEALMRVVIRQREGTGMISSGMGAMTADGVELRRAIPEAYAMPSSRIEGLDRFDDEKYTIVVSAPHRDDDAMRALLRTALESTFRFEARREPRTRTVLEVRAPGDGTHKLEPSATESGTFMYTLHNEIRSQHVTVANLVAALENVIRLPLRNGTGIDGRFDITLRFDAGVRSMSEEDRIAHLTEAMREQLGLELVSAQREIEVLVIVPKDDQ